MDNIDAMQQQWSNQRQRVNKSMVWGGMLGVGVLVPLAAASAVAVATPLVAAITGTAAVLGVLGLSNEQVSSDRVDRLSVAARLASQDNPSSNIDVTAELASTQSAIQAHKDLSFKQGLVATGLIMGGTLAMATAPLVGVGLLATAAYTVYRVAKTNQDIEASVDQLGSLRDRVLGKREKEKGGPEQSTASPKASM